MWTFGDLAKPVSLHAWKAITFLGLFMYNFRHKLNKKKNPDQQYEVNNFPQKQVSLNPSNHNKEAYLDGSNTTISSPPLWSPGTWSFMGPVILCCNYYSPFGHDSALGLPLPKNSNINILPSLGHHVYCTS